MLKNSIRLKKRHLFIYILSIAFIGACSGDKKKFDGQLVSDFPPAIKLSGTRIFKNEIGLRSILKIDSLFVISTDQDTLIHIYDRNHHLITSFGRKGKGPGEFSHAPLIWEAISKDSTTHIFFYNRPSVTLSEINLTASIEANKTIVDTVYELPRELKSALHVYYVDGTKFIGDYSDRPFKQFDGKRGVFYYHPKSKKLETVPQFNVKIDPDESLPAININARTTDLSPDRTRFATVLIYYPALEILNVGSSITNGYLLKSNPPLNVFSLKDFKARKLKVYYKFIDATNNYIYLLYSGHKDNENPHVNRIQVLDWQGHPHAQYIIPAKYNLGSFYVDEKNKVFYGISYQDDAVYKFDYDRHS